MIQCHVKREKTFSPIGHLFRIIKLSLTSNRKQSGNKIKSHPH